MKPNIIIVILVFLISISITACSSNKSSSGLNISSSTCSNKTSTTSVPTSNPTSSPTTSTNIQYLAMEAYKSVLQNKVNFFSMGDCFSDDKKYLYLDNLLKDTETPENPTLKITHFTILDMDGDKTPEVVLELSVVGKEYPDFYEVLHYINGTVYGYNFPYRGLEALKTDGTFRYSSGAGDYGTAKLRFSSNACEDEKLGYCESSDNKEGMTESYFINNKPVTAESFESFCKEQDEKEDVVWYEFSQKNIEKELSNK